MTNYEKKQEILRLFDQLTMEEQEDYIADVIDMLIENSRKAEYEE